MLYTKSIFQPDSPTEVFDLVDEITLGTLITPLEGRIQISHPVFMADRERNRLISHVARSNNHAEVIESGLPSTAILMDHGSYISSSWYPALPTRDSAPTWAFRVAHIHGRVEVISRAATLKHLSDLVAHLEHGRPNTWNMNELGVEGIERRLPNILGYELIIEHVEVSFRLGQDERSRDMAAAAQELRSKGQERLANRICTARNKIYDDV